MKNNSFIKEFENKVKQTLQKYKLVSKGKKEKIVVALSGGKDSTTTAYLLKKFSKEFGYDIIAFHINLYIGKYSERCLEASKKFCKENKIPLHIYDIRKETGCSICHIRSGVQQRLKVKNCLICGVVKKWILNKEAQELGADKIATGHNLDDEAQTILMNFFKGNLMLNANSGPVVGIIRDKKFVTRIKPLFFMPESDVRKYSMLMKFPVVYEKCPCAIDSYRIIMRKFLQKVDKNNRLKEKIIKNFLFVLPKLRRNIEIEKLQYCEKCGEPSHNEICKRCELLYAKV